MSRLVNSPPLSSTQCHTDIGTYLDKTAGIDSFLPGLSLHLVLLVSFLMGCLLGYPGISPCLSITRHTNFPSKRWLAMPSAASYAIGRFHLLSLSTGRLFTFFPSPSHHTVVSSRPGGRCRRTPSVLSLLNKSPSLEPRLAKIKMKIEDKTARCRSKTGRQDVDRRPDSRMWPKTTRRQDRDRRRRDGKVVT